MKRGPKPKRPAPPRPRPGTAGPPAHLAGGGEEGGEAEVRQAVEGPRGVVEHVLRRVEQVHALVRRDRPARGACARRVNVSRAIPGVLPCKPKVSRSGLQRPPCSTSCCACRCRSGPRRASRGRGTRSRARAPGGVPTRIQMGERTTRTVTFPNRLCVCYTPSIDSLL